MELRILLVYYQAILIVGGVVGTSIGCYLGKFGWTDNCLLKRSALTDVASWHVGDDIHALNANLNMAVFRDFSPN